MFFLFDLAINLDKSHCSVESLLVEFPEEGELVEVVPCVKVNLPSEVTGNIVIWVESAQPGASAYHLVHPLNDKSNPVIKYINNS